jgi:hypothetical protein
MTTLLTDDEVVAIAAHRGRPWPTIVTSVDTSSAHELASAMVRGTRSLVVRGLARTESGAIRLAGPLDTLIEPLFDDPSLHVYSAPQRSPGQVDGGVVYIYPQDTSGRYPIEVVRGYGLHELSAVGRNDALALLARLIEAAFDRDPASQGAVDSANREPEARALYLSAAPGPGRDAVEISHGRVAWGTYPEEGASEGGFVCARVSDAIESSLPAWLLPA